MIRRSPRLMLTICCTVVALAASGAGLVAAMPASGAPVPTSQSNPGSGQWNLAGNNSVDVGYDGSDLVYSVTFTQSGSSLSGTLTDPYYPTSGNVSGTVSGNSVTFTFTYPSGSVQGTRTYTGTISSAGAVSGDWTQTGSEVPDNGTWNLATNAAPVASSSPTASATATPTPSPTPTCEDPNHSTTVTEHAGEDALPELFTDTITLSWCADSDSQPQIFSSTQVSNVATSGFSFSGVLIKLDEEAGITFSVTPATAPQPTVDNGQTSSSTTASGLSFTSTLNLGKDLILLIPGGLLTKAAARILPLLRSGQLTRASAELSALWASAVTLVSGALTKDFGLSKYAADVLAEFGLDKLVDSVKEKVGEFITDATTSMAALGRHPTLTSVVNSLESAIQRVASALTFTAVEWSPKITITVNTGSQSPSVDDSASFVGLNVDVQQPPAIVTT